jgi:hypothetical protein
VLVAAQGSKSLGSLGQAKLFALSDAPSGENSGEFTMKQPKLNELVIDRKGTQRMRAEAVKTRKVKITINIDQDPLGAG